jgi:uncharacterized protein (DUF1697 family)
MSDAPSPDDTAGSQGEWRVALLRGVNVGGHGKVAMTDLKAMLAELGFASARTLLQSGNAVFRGDDRDDAALEALLEQEAATRLDLRTEFFVRTPDEWRALIDANPLPDIAEGDPGHLLVMFLKDPPKAAAVDALQQRITGPEVVRSGARHVYISYPEGMGNSRLTGAVIERALDTRCTGRNWNTVRKLAALVLS